MLLYKTNRKAGTSLKKSIELPKNLDLKLLVYLTEQNHESYLQIIIF